MLKLEKIAKSLEISIFLKKRDSFFSASLLKAFGIAIALHLFAGLVFTVSPFRIIGSQSIFPPVLVDTELTTIAENVVVAQVDTEEISPRYIKEPRQAALHMPPLPTTRTLEHPAIAVQSPECNALQCAITERELSPLDIVSLQQNKVKKQPIEIVMSGDLAERSIVESGLTTAQSAYFSPTRLVFSVQVDDRSGTIFWYEPHFYAENMVIGEKILKDLRFQMIADSFVTVGEIEIHFNEAQAG